MAGLNMPNWNTFSADTSSSTSPSTGVASTWMTEVPYSAHTKSGILNQVMPGARMVWTVTMKFRPVRMLLKPEDEDRQQQGRQGRRRLLRVGRVERPAGVRAAGDHPAQREDRARQVEVEAEEVQPRERHVLGAEHDRHQEVPHARRDRRDEEQEDHDHPVEGEDAVVRLRLHDRRAGRQVLEAHQQRVDASDQEEHQHRAQEHHRDALVIRRQEPRADRGSVDQIALVFLVVLRASGRGGATGEAHKRDPWKRCSRRRGCAAT